MKEEDKLQRIESALEEVKQMLRQIIGGHHQNSIEEDNTYLNVKQVARLLGVEPSTVYAKCRHGNLPYTRVGKYYRFNKEEVAQWMKHPEIPVVDIDQFVDKYLQKNIFRG